jgi:hypothetical protein
MRQKLEELHPNPYKDGRLRQSKEVPAGRKLWLTGVEVKDNAISNVPAVARQALAEQTAPPASAPAPAAEPVPAVPGGDQPAPPITPPPGADQARPLIPPPPPSGVEEAPKTVRPGMTADEVTGIMGQPIAKADRGARVCS